MIKEKKLIMLDKRTGRTHEATSRAYAELQRSPDAKHYVIQDANSSEPEPEPLTARRSSAKNTQPQDVERSDYNPNEAKPQPYLQRPPAAPPNKPEPALVAEKPVQIKTPMTKESKHE